MCSGAPSTTSLRPKPLHGKPSSASACLSASGRGSSLSRCPSCRAKVTEHPTASGCAPRCELLHLPDSVLVPRLLRETRDEAVAQKQHADQRLAELTSQYEKLNLESAAPFAPPSSCAAYPSLAPAECGCHPPSVFLHGCICTWDSFRTLQANSEAQIAELRTQVCGDWDERSDKQSLQEAGQGSGQKQKKGTMMGRPKRGTIVMDGAAGKSSNMSQKKGSVHATSCEESVDPRGAVTPSRLWLVRFPSRHEKGRGTRAAGREEGPCAAALPSPLCRAFL